MMPRTWSQYRKGDTVFFCEQCDCYPHYQIPKGATGIIVQENHLQEEDVVWSYRVFMDSPVEGLTDTEWDNCVHLNDRDHSGDIISRY